MIEEELDKEQKILMMIEILEKGLRKLMDYAEEAYFRTPPTISSKPYAARIYFLSASLLNIVISLKKSLKEHTYPAVF
ncbi:MAG: hypothetical protein ABWW69_00805 [Pyrodictiaceae archaeon]